MTAPIPEEFSRQPDTYDSIPEIWVDADYYLDGQLVHPGRRHRRETPQEHSPGWTVQGGPHGEPTQA